MRASVAASGVVASIVALACTGSARADPQGAVELVTIVPPTVKTSSGTVWGTELPASAGGTVVNQFLGIPFAHAKRSVDFPSLSNLA